MEGSSPRLLLVVVVAGQRVALPACAVAEIVLEPRLIHPPAMPPVLAGLFLLRGRVVPVVRPNVLLDLPALVPGPFRAMLVLAAAEPWALLVDHADEVCSGVEAPASADVAFNDCVATIALVAGAAVPVLAPERLLRRREVEALTEFSRRAAERWEEFAGAHG